MANTEVNDIQNARIQGLLARFLRMGPAASQNVASPRHLDEDTLNAFTEGRMSEREALPVVRHLTDCSFCRHLTVELVRLEMHFEETFEPVTERQASSEPVSVSSVLSGILSRIFGSSDAAVFAHEEKKRDEPDDKTTTDDDAK